MEIGLTVIGAVLDRFSSAVRGIVWLQGSIVGPPTPLDARTILLLLRATGLPFCWTAVSRPSTRRVGNGV
jgi:hypothetical protein